MGKVTYDAATSLDGFIADEHDSLDWLFAVPGGDEAQHELLPSGITVNVMGSTTYLWVVEHEDVLAHPEKWRDMFGRTPTYVFTTRQLPVAEGADVRFVSGPVVDALPAIRAAAGEGGIWVVGGGDLAGQFLDAGALDEIALSVTPVALAAGAPVFGRRIESDRLRLVSARAFGQFARLVYEVIPA